MTLTLEISEQALQRLQQISENQSLAPEVVAASVLEDALRQSSQTSDEKFRALAQGVIDDHRELLERLA